VRRGLRQVRRSRAGLTRRETVRLVIQQQGRAEPHSVAQGRSIEINVFLVCPSFDARNSDSANGRGAVAADCR
jgi:hypothetical protein